MFWTNNKPIKFVDCWKVFALLTNNDEQKFILFIFYYYFLKRTSLFDDKDSCWEPAGPLLRQLFTPFCRAVLVSLKTDSDSHRNYSLIKQAHTITHFLFLSHPPHHHLNLLPVKLNCSYLTVSFSPWWSSKEQLIIELIILAPSANSFLQFC